jgi:hypothetical protein
VPGGDRTAIGGEKWLGSADEEGLEQNAAAPSNRRRVRRAPKQNDRAGKNLLGENEPPARFTRRVLIVLRIRCPDRAIKKAPDRSGAFAFGGEFDQREWFSGPNLI